MSKATKTEHNGAKNGGGYWGLRVVAKQQSKKLRRWVEKRIIKQSLNEDKQAGSFEKPN